MSGRVLPLLSAYNPSRNTGYYWKQAMLLRKRKGQRRRKQRGGQFSLAGATLPISVVARKARSRRKKQRGGSIAAGLGPPAREIQAAELARRWYRESRKKKKRQGGGNIFEKAAKIGYTLGKDKRNHRMSFSGFSDQGGKRYYKPWEV